MPGYVAHMDADCFYVSAERVRHPELAGVPVGVLGNNGTCVIAKSYEMKPAGVKTGTPIWDAKRLCPYGPTNAMNQSQSPSPSATSQPL
jgi:DNA polymerase V